MLGLKEAVNAQNRTRNAVLGPTLSLASSLVWGEWSKLSPRCFYCRLGAHQGISGWAKKISFLPGFELLAFKLASRNNDYAIPTAVQ